MIYPDRLPKPVVDVTYGLARGIGFIASRVLTAGAYPELAKAGQALQMDYQLAGLQFHRSPEPLTILNEQDLPELRRAHS